MEKKLQPTVLIVEDEETIVTMLQYALENENYKVISTDSGEVGVSMVEDNSPDIVLLDWMLPDMSGIEVCKKLRASEKSKAIPIIMLTAKGEEEDRVTGLDSGADDYIVKPFSPNELVARINAVFRRIRPAFTQKNLIFEDLSMDLVERTVTRGDKNLQLGPKEFMILQCLMEYPRRVMSRDHIMNQIWGHDIYVEPRTVDVHINRLRKVVNDGFDTQLIKTIRSVGYRLMPQSDTDDE